MQYELFSDEDFLQTTPFTDRIVSLLGSFKTPAKQLREKLTALGADIRPALTTKTHFAIIGNAIPADKQERLDDLLLNGYQIRLLSEADLSQIFQGHYSDYMVPEQVCKKLHLTYRHFQAANIDLSKRADWLYTKELYLAPDTDMTQAELYQALGNRGVYANPYIDDTTDLIVISDRSVQHLRDGETDDILHYIESQYDISRSPAFRMSMVSESQLRSWLG